MKKSNKTNQPKINLEQFMADGHINNQVFIENVYKSFWSNLGMLQKYNEIIFDKYIPYEGACTKTTQNCENLNTKQLSCLNRLRVFNKKYYRYFNDGDSINLKLYVKRYLHELTIISEIVPKIQLYLNDLENTNIIITKYDYMNKTKKALLNIITNLIILEVCQQLNIEISL